MPMEKYTWKSYDAESHMLSSFYYKGLWTTPVVVQECLGISITISGAENRREYFRVVKSMTIYNSAFEERLTTTHRQYSYPCVSARKFPSPLLPLVHPHFEKLAAFFGSRCKTLAVVGTDMQVRNGAHPLDKFFARNNCHLFILALWHATLQSRGSNTRNIYLRYKFLIEALWGWNYSIKELFRRFVKRIKTIRPNKKLTSSACERLLPSAD